MTNTKVSWTLISVNFIMAPVPFIFDFIVRVKELVGDIKDLLAAAPTDVDGGCVTV